jgi:catechol 2,3-dioxygenase-like lactoylglutathione lyase family enzyme
MRLTGHATVLLVPDVRETLRWYAEVLGFETEVVDYAGEPPVYGFARRDECSIHLGQAEARPNSQVVPPDMFDAYIWVDEVDALHEELVSRGAELLHGPVDQEYGLREIRVRDPNGYILAIGTPLA